MRLTWIAWGLAVALASFSAKGEVCTGPVGGAEGQCAPDFKLADLSGKQVRLSELRGKVVFLNFWASWCEPCKVEVPSMERAYAKLKPQGIVMLAVSIDSEGKRAIDPFFGTKNPVFPVLLDSNQEVSHRYGTFKVPETYLIDKGGRIRDKIIGAKEWDDSVLVHYLTLLNEQK